ncbi:MAG: HD domain-containing protein [Armatimonas sp.]
MYTDRFTGALALAHELHREQKRKGTDIPYISHLLTVAGIAIEHGAEEDEAIAALLHDSLEDTPITIEDLTRRFGERVAHTVAGCTDDLPGIDRSSIAGWQARKEAYLAHLTPEHITSSILLVSCADKLANARSIIADVHAIGDAVFTRFKAGKTSTLWYYRALADRFLMLRESALTENRPGLAVLIAIYIHTIEELERIS